MPGQAMGDAITNVLFGEVNPSGKLPLTFPNKENEQEMTVAQYPGLQNGENATYSEGFFFGYRWYDKHKVTPKFSFGHGLSYTTFSYSKLSIDGRTVSVDLTNTGKVDGAEVVQLYVSDLDANFRVPNSSLKGVKRIKLNPREIKKVTFKINKEMLQFVDYEGNSVFDPGLFEISIGNSSPGLRSLELGANFSKVNFTVN